MLALLACDHGGFDIALANLAGSGQGFPLREDWWLAQVLHNGVRRLAWALVLGLSLLVWWPVGAMREVPQIRRLQWAASALGAAALIALAKSFSDTSCPWDLQTFGGYAPYVTHWQLRPDGGPGHCFPAGHASTGFGFVGGYFALRRSHPIAGRVVLAASLSSGLLLGLAQQWRGAHFMSHTLRTGWICWVAALALDGALGEAR